MAKGLVGSVTGALGIGNGDRKRANQARELGGLENLRTWKDLKIPSIEEQSLILQNPDLMGQYSPEQLQYMQAQQSSMEQAGADPATINAQNEALRQLQEVSQGGLTEGDKAASREIQRTVSQDSQARQKAILNSMAQRGTLGSGMELAAQLQGAQQASEQMSRGGEGLTQQAQARALQALGQQGQLASQMHGQQFGEQADKARARDAINQFNTQNQQNVANQNIGERNRAQTMNLAAAQERENERAALANKQQITNKGLYQNQFVNQYNKIQGQTGANTAFRGAEANTAASNAIHKVHQADAIGSGIGTLFGGFAQGGLVTKPQHYQDGGLAISEGLDPNSPYYQANQAILNSPEHQARIEEQKRKIMESQVPQQPAPQMTEAPMAPATELDPRYKTAIEESRKRQGYADMLNMFKSALEDPSIGYKSDKSAVDMLNRRAQEPLQDYTQLKTQDTEAAAKQKAGLETAKSKQELKKGELGLKSAQMEQDYKTKLSDPMSQESQQLQDLTLRKIKQLNWGIPEEKIRNLSGQQLSNTFPTLENEYKQLIHGQEFEKEQNLKRDLLKDTIAGRNEVAMAGKEAKEDAVKEKQIVTYEKRLNEDLDPNRARGGNFAKSQAVVNSAERLEGLFSQFPDGNVPKSQTVELATAVAGLIGGGSAQSQHQIDLLTPSTLRGDVQGIASWITGNPYGQEQQAFIHLMQDTAKREKQIAHDQIKKVQMQRLSAYDKYKKLDPEGYNRIVEAHIMGDVGGNTGPLGETTVRNGKTYKWNAQVKKYQLIGQ